jgi:hypothetical protein
MLEIELCSLKAEEKILETWASRLATQNSFCCLCPGLNWSRWFILTVGVVLSFYWGRRSEHTICGLEPFTELADGKSRVSGKCEVRYRMHDLSYYS